MITRWVLGCSLGTPAPKGLLSLVYITHICIFLMRLSLRLRAILLLSHPAMLSPLFFHGSNHALEHYAHSPEPDFLPTPKVMSKTVKINVCPFPRERSS